MPDFEVSLKFVQITPATPPPRETNLLFYNTATTHMARGWITQEGDVVLIGGQWQPTHYAEHCYPIADAAERAGL